MMILLIALLVILIISLLWMTGFLIVTDFSVPLKDAKPFRRVLVIFPHADDEVITCGGSLHHFSVGGSMVTIAILTKGERGPNATHSENLKGTRTREAQVVAEVLGLSRLIQEDFGDGALRYKKPELTMFIAALIEQEKPDLLITYDLVGFYGHIDHITCSEIVTELKKNRFPEIALWYATLPKRVLARISLPKNLTIDPHFQERRAFPTHRIFIGASVFPKIQSWYTYKSQRASFKEGIRKYLPIWFFLSMVLFEYFAEVD